MVERQSQEARLLALARSKGIVRARELREAGIHHEVLRRLAAKARLVRTGRGLYILPDAEVTTNHSLAEVAKLVPHGVICLLSALRFHGIGTQAPHEVWVAIGRRRAYPRISRPRLRVMRFSGPALTDGIQEHRVEGVLVRVYSPAKTVADCFKYRNKIGLDVALEALREALRAKKCTADDLWRCANICRVAGVIGPYMEAYFES